MLSHLFQWHSERPAVEVRHVDFAFAERKAEVDAKMKDEIVALLLKIGVWQLLDGEDHVLQRSIMASCQSPKIGRNSVCRRMINFQKISGRELNALLYSIALGKTL